MKSVKVRDITIGEGKPIICVPIVAAEKEEILGEAGLIADAHPDLVEFRADFYEGVKDFESTATVLRELRNILKDIPILFTLRSYEEGGEAKLSNEEYIEINIKAIRSGLIDMSDIELLRGDAAVRELIKIAHDEGVKVIVSNHDFEGTPDEKTIIHRMSLMQELGADVAKIAVMPRSSEDVAILIAAAEQVRETSECPIIAISMGELGMITRTDCESLGSSMTYASLSKASAPGQIGIDEIRAIQNRK